MLLSCEVPSMSHVTVDAGVSASMPFSGARSSTPMAGDTPTTASVSPTRTDDGVSNQLSETRIHAFWRRATIPVWPFDFAIVSAERPSGSAAFGAAPDLSSSIQRYSSPATTVARHSISVFPLV
jgi:hypothetical protein